MKKLTLTVFIFGLLFVGCTDNDRARKFGGVEDIYLKPNEKLVNMTWKETNLWVLTEDTLTGIQYFREKSRYGLMEGQIVVHGAK